MVHWRRQELAPNHYHKDILILCSDMHLPAFPGRFVAHQIASVINNNLLLHIGARVHQPKRIPFFECALSFFDNNAFSVLLSYFWNLSLVFFSGWKQLDWNLVTHLNHQLYVSSCSKHLLALPYELSRWVSRLGREFIREIVIVAFQWIPFALVRT